MEAGPSSAAPFAVGLSGAHASVRFFGPDIDHAKVDSALAAALSSEDPWSAGALQAYAEELPSVCVLSAATGELPGAEVVQSDNTAIIKPGTGDLALPEGVERVVIDLRQLPETPELPEALERAVSLALATPVERARFDIRKHNGLTDEAYAPLVGIDNIYSNIVEHVTPEPIPSGGSADLPIVLLTSERMAPSAASMAISLRLANRAWIAGEDLLAAVAEARWMGVGSSGVLYRDRFTSDWPDTIPADVRSAEPEAEVAALFEKGTPSSVQGAAEREPIEKFSEELAIQPDEHDLGHARAVLLVAHGTARLFFPYFPVVGDTIDQGLLTELDTLASTEETGSDIERAALRRWSYYLHDSHGFVFYLGQQSPAAGTLPVLLDETEDGSVVVRTSALGTFHPGDEILEIDGREIGDLIAELDTFGSASNAGSQRRDSLAAARNVRGDSVWLVRTPEGDELEIEVPLTAATGAPPPVCTRTAGFLTDLGQPTLYYVNLDGPAYDGAPNAAELANNANGATGLILDGRGYPDTIETWNLIKRVLSEPSAVKFRTPQVTSLGTTMKAEDQPWNPIGLGTEDHYAGPVAVLIGPWTQSQAEHILMSLVSTERATLVGRQSAGANGNITGVMLPSARGLTFTGTEVRFADDSTFHGIGIQPTLTVHPTVAQLADGVDPELAAAITALTD